MDTIHSCRGIHSDTWIQPYCRSNTQLSASRTDETTQARSIAAACLALSITGHIHTSCRRRLPVPLSEHFKVPTSPEPLSSVVVCRRLASSVVVCRRLSSSAVVAVASFVRSFDCSFDRSMACSPSHHRTEYLRYYYIGINSQHKVSHSSV